MRVRWPWIVVGVLAVLGAVGVRMASRGERPRFLTIHEAVREGDLADVKYHLEHGSSVNEVDESKYSLLHSAAAYGRPRIADYLLQKGAEVDARQQDITPRNYTPLHLAAWENSTEVARLLLRHGGDPNARDEDGYTPLHLAARHNSAQAAEVLLQSGADVNAQNDEEDTPLAVAVKWEKLEVGRVLVQYGGVRRSGRRGPAVR